MQSHDIPNSRHPPVRGSSAYCSMTVLYPPLTLGLSVQSLPGLKFATHRPPQTQPNVWDVRQPPYPAHMWPVYGEAWTRPDTTATSGRPTMAQSNPTPVSTDTIARRPNLSQPHSLDLSAAIPSPSLSSPLPDLSPPFCHARRQWLQRD